jgi:beta-lactamase superfamily II metal-dependent hydrolase
MAETRLAGYPAARLYESSTGSKAKNHLLWGDWLTVTGEPENGRTPVHARRDDGWVESGALQEDPLLELVFADIGQGDGCLIVMPDGRKLVLDAGEGNNMNRFLRWRFDGFAKPLEFDAFLITHSDKDHYGGFRELLDEPQVRARTIFHNGLVEREGDELLGPRRVIGGRTYCVELVLDDGSMRALLGNEAAVGGKMYPRMLRKAAAAGKVDRIIGVGCAPGGQPSWLPGYEPSAAGGVTVQLLGPAREAAGGVEALRWFGDAGRTKNGHSLVVKIRHGGVSIVLGGDLNIPAEEWLLERHTGLGPTRDNAAEEALVAAARPVFECDVAKACHHGSADMTDVFLRALNALVTVVSSGDEESYAHPRSDTLGALGRYGRGRRPLIFSTELARSSPERIERAKEIREDFTEARDASEEAAAGVATGLLAGAVEKLAKARTRFADLLERYVQRSVGVYGAINLRTDGRRLVMAYRIEKPRDPGRKWDVYAFEPDASGALQFVARSD